MLLSPRTEQSVKLVIDLSNQRLVFEPDYPVIYIWSLSVGSADVDLVLLCLKYHGA